MLQIKRRRVMVNLVSGEAVEGDVVPWWPFGYRLRNARVHSKGQIVKADGMVKIGRRAVLFVQVFE